MEFWIKNKKQNPVLKMVEEQNREIMCLQKNFLKVNLGLKLLEIKEKIARWKCGKLYNVDHQMH